MCSESTTWILKLKHYRDRNVYYSTKWITNVSKKWGNLTIFLLSDRGSRVRLSTRNNREYWYNEITTNFS